MTTGVAELLGLVDAREPWRRDALCREHPDVDFYPPDGRIGAAKAVCARCAVRAECLAYALATRQDHGIWGGTSERERRRLRAAA